MTRICTAAARYSALNVVGICHQIDFGYMMAGRILGKTLGLPVKHDYLFRWDRDPEEHRIAALARERLDIRAAGINHFTWFLSIRDRKTGEELLPLFYKLFLAQKEFEPYTRDIIEIFGCCPVSGDAHLLEYLPYTGNMNRTGWKRYHIQMYPLKAQAARRDTMWQNIYDMAAGKQPLDMLRDVHTERAETMIAALWEGEDHFDYAVNIPNTGRFIANLPNDAIVEVPATLGLQGIQGLSVGDMPRVPAAFCQRQVDIVELAVKAAVEGDRYLALQALAMDPMIDDLDVARGLLDDGLRAFKKYLPQFH
jgi:alpha-galactosidase